MEKELKRPAPTQRLISELCGGDAQLLAALHHGLAETPVDGLYPYLNLDELVAFEIGSWDLRRKNSDFFIVNPADNMSLYEIFNIANEGGFKWLKSRRRISGTSDLYLRLTPFHGRDLRKRLEMVDPETVERLREDLKMEPKEWVFECQYHDAKARKGGDNQNIRIMTFQNVYPKKGRIAPAYVAEIAKILRTYPREYSSDSPNQPTLFS